MISATRALAEYAVAGSYDDLPTPVIAHTKTAILNILGAALGGADVTHLRVKGLGIERIADFEPAAVQLPDDRIGEIIDAVENLEQQIENVATLAALLVP